MRGELEEKETALATLQKELDKEKWQHGQTEITKDKVIRDFTAYQKEMFSTDSLDPAVTSEESPETEAASLSVMSEASEGGKGTGKQGDTQKTLNCFELTDYINQKFNLKKPISKQNIIDAASRKTKKMPQFESDYGFKFLGKIRGEYRFKILN